MCSRGHTDPYRPSILPHSICSKAHQSRRFSFQLGTGLVLRLSHCIDVYVLQVLLLLLLVVILRHLGVLNPSPLPSDTPEAGTCIRNEGSHNHEESTNANKSRIPPDPPLQPRGGPLCRIWPHMAQCCAERL
ncbi:hypothetical protein BV22DRAFT_799443 [Leucogyrophana mollusca]|uniref:Uncharacterized protein n=1 Tax=Leucogyrophana mollusca TaxID=85980 RepID=A0ACB8B504_9AGAM|nr:hypothetical protein BV22DRAFT_799443 [Leucogyrophana mollusca]